MITGIGDMTEPAVRYVYIVICIILTCDSAIVNVNFAASAVIPQTTGSEMHMAHHYEKLKV